MIKHSLSLQSRHSPYQNSISEGFAYGNAEKGEVLVGTHIAQRDGKCATQHWQEAEEAHPGSPTLKPTLSLLHLIPLDMQVLLYPLQLAEGADPIVEHTAQDVAQRGAEEQRPRLKACQLESSQKCLAAKREDTAGNEGCNAHSPVAQGHHKLNNGIHRLI